MRLDLTSFVAWIERHYRAIVLASAALGVLSALSLVRLRLDIDVLSMLPHGEPAFDEFRSYVGDFGELNELFVVLEADDPGRLPRFASALVPRLRASDTIERVQARVDVDQLLDGLLGRRLYNYIPEGAWDEVANRFRQDEVDRRIAANRAVLSAPFDLSAARQIAQDPLGLRRLAAESLTDSYGGAAPSLSSGYFASPDGQALILFVRPRQSAFDIAFTERLMQQVSDAVAATRAELGESPDSVKAVYAGSYAYALEDKHTLRTDLLRYTVLALIGVLAVFWVGFRNLRILPFVTYPLILTTLIAFAMGVLIYDQLNVVSLCFAAILYGLSIDSAIHFYTRLLEERRDTPNLRRAVTATLARIGRAHTAASSTTAAAFLVIGISALTAVSEMGILTAIGMGVSSMCFFLLHPALSFLLPRGSSPELAPAHTPRLARWAEGSARHARPITVAALIATPVLLLLARGVHLDVSLDHLRPSDSNAARVQDEIARRFGDAGGKGAAVVRRANLEDALVASELIAARLRQYRGEGSIEAVNSVDGALPSAKTQRARLARFRSIAGPAAAERLRDGLLKQGFAPEKFRGVLDAVASPPEGDDALVRWGDPELEPLGSLISHHVRRHGDEFIVATYVEPAPATPLGEVAARLQRDLPDVKFGFASRLLLEEELGRVLQRELFWFLVYGVAGNLALLLLLYRDVAFSVAIMLPVVLVVLALFAFMAVAGIAIDPVNLVVTPLVFGIGVDYSVYVATRARECGDVARALLLSGRALVVTALTTTAGFGFLGLSRYPFLASMGLLSSLGLVLSLALAITLLPALLVAFARRPEAPALPAA